MHIEGYSHSVRKPTGRVTYYKTIEGEVVWDFDVSGSDIEIFRDNNTQDKLKMFLDGYYRDYLIGCNLESNGEL